MNYAILETFKDRLSNASYPVKMKVLNILICTAKK